jgi:hypothetical protein
VGKRQGRFPYRKTPAFMILFDDVLIDVRNDDFHINACIREHLRAHRTSRRKNK